MEPWEALDVDDSDLPSLLRPCKRRRDSSGHISAAAQSQSNHLTPSSSSLSPHLTQPSQTLDSSFQSQLHPPSPVSSSLPHFIPGPAGAVQSAMLRKTLDRQSCPSEEPPIATQEYIRRAIEDAVEDEDFQCNPWLSAIEFLTDGTEDGLIPTTPLNSIKKIVNIGRVDQVVAVIKSCTPNGLGDLMVNLKDPTGTISGSIHRKVLTESEFGKDISNGSVLILQKVAVFAPSRSAHYLNITVSNVLKVFRKDSGPSLQQKDSPDACAVKYADPSSEQRAETSMSGKDYPLDHRRTEDTMNGTRVSGIAREKSHVTNHTDKRYQFQGNVNENDINLTRNANVGKESLLGRKVVSKKFSKKQSVCQISQDECRGSGNIEKFVTGGILSSSPQHQNVLGNSSEKEVRIDPVQQQKEVQLMSASLPQWTDEQLDELFALDCEDI